MNGGQQRIILAGLFLLALTASQGCRPRDKQHTASDKGDFYFDYKVQAEEGKDKLTILLQFREEENGDALSIRDAGSISLDGEPLPEDSSRLTGFYYELHKPVDSFAGTHELLFTGRDGKKYRETFDFQPMRLREELPETVSRKDFELSLDGLRPREAVRLLLTDTSFLSNGVNLLDSVQQGRLQVSAAELEDLANGPVQLELVREYERPLRQAPEKGGRLLVTYSLKRDFRLTDE